MKTRRITVYIMGSDKKGRPGAVKMIRPGMKDRWIYHKEKSSAGLRKLEARIIKDISKHGLP